MNPGRCGKTVKNICILPFTNDKSQTMIDMLTDLCLLKKKKKKESQATRLVHYHDTDWSGSSGEALAIAREKLLPKRQNYY